MGETVNGLPVAILVILGGAGLVIVLWLVMRFSRAIAVFLAGGAILTAIVAGTVALAGQSAANYQTAQVAVEAVEVAQTAQTGNLLLVGALGCAGGVALLAVLALVGVAVFLWYRLQMAERQRPAQRPAMLPQPAPQLETGYTGDFDLSWLDDDNWVQQGESAWAQTENLHW